MPSPTQLLERFIRAASALPTQDARIAKLAAIKTIAASMRTTHAGGRKPVPTPCRCGAICESRRASQQHCPLSRR